MGDTRVLAVNLHSCNLALWWPNHIFKIKNKHRQIGSCSKTFWQAKIQKTLRSHHIPAEDSLVCTFSFETIAMFIPILKWLENTCNDSLWAQTFTTDKFKLHAKTRGESHNLVLHNLVLESNPAWQPLGKPLLKVKLLVGPTCKIQRPTQRGYIRE